MIVFSCCLPKQKRSFKIDYCYNNLISSLCVDAYKVAENILHISEAQSTQHRG